MYTKWTLQQRGQSIISGALSADTRIEPMLLTLGMMLGGIAAQCYMKDYTEYSFTDETTLRLYYN